MYIEPFTHTRIPFSEQTTATTFDAAVGLVAVGFSYLEDSLSGAIGALLELDAEETVAVTAEMSFKNKVHLCASLLRMDSKWRRCNFVSYDRDTYVRELTSACFRAEDLRNAVMHSSWASGAVSSSMARRRRKVTAKARLGVHIVEQELSDGDVLDIHDYSIYIANELEELIDVNGSAT